MLNLIVATQMEARPLIAHFHLQAANLGSAFPLYHKDDLRLIISGIGKIAAAAATAYLFGLAPENLAAWLNVGIAGHGQAEIGQALLIHKIVEHSSGRTHYPAIAFAPACPTTTAITVERPEQEYREPCAYEMEACGFWPTANLFSTAEIVHCLKIVSDNKENSINTLNKQRVEALIAQHLDLVGDLVQLLSATAAQLTQRRQPPLQFDYFLKRWHFTTTQRHQLQRLLAHWQALSPECSFTEDQLKDLHTGRDILSFLRHQLADLSLDLCSTSSI